jgi:transposase-like protein
MERIPRQKYTKEFREQAVRLVLEQDLTTPEAARRLAMSDKTLCKLGVSSSAWPARDTGREPTARDGVGGRGLSAEARTRRGADGA